MSLTETPASDLLEGYVTEAEVAAARGIGIRALRAERARREGPPFVRVSRQIYYERAAFRAWLKSLEIRPARSAGKAA